MTLTPDWELADDGADSYKKRKENILVVTENHSYIHIYLSYSNQTYIVNELKQ